MSVWFEFFYSIPNQIKLKLIEFFNRFDLTFRFGANFRFGLYTPNTRLACLFKKKIISKYLCRVSWYRLLLSIVP